MPDKNNDDIIFDKEDVTYDSEDNSQSLSDATDKIKKLKEELKSCKEEKQEYLDGWQRSKADFMNLKKRSSEEILESQERAYENLIFDLLPTLDSFDMAFKNKEAWESAPEQWRKGVEHIHTQLSNLIESYGVKVIDPLNKDFDPIEHHSTATEKTDDKSKDGKILEVILKGYKIKDKLLRPARVKVGLYES